MRMCILCNMSSAADQKKPVLTADQKKRVRELVEDEGWTRAEAVILVREGGDK